MQSVRTLLSVNGVPSSLLQYGPAAASVQSPHISLVTPTREKQGAAMDFLAYN